MHIISVISTEIKKKTTKLGVGTGQLYVTDLRVKLLTSGPRVVMVTIIKVIEPVSIHNVNLLPHNNIT